MAKAKGRYGTTGRVTPKKDEVVEADRVGPAPSGRYTPPVPKEWRESPKWVPILMFAFLGLGALLIVVNYTPLMDKVGGSSNWYLLGGLGLVTAGFITATKWE
ncbi:MAG TPA: cell division protein CrgA [Acidimicrobiales bacterium]|nr:cell division protein CrgA [Acidimicrobiales bacterium]